MLGQWNLTRPFSYSYTSMFMLIHVPFYCCAFSLQWYMKKKRHAREKMIVSPSKIYNILLPSSIPCSIRLKSCKSDRRYNRLFFSLINSAVPCNRKLKQVSADLAYASRGRNLSGNYGFASPALSPIVCIRHRYFCHRLLRTAVLSMPAFIGNPSSSAEFK